MDIVNYGWLVATDVRPPEGWSLIVADLLASMDDVVAGSGAIVSVRQIKEKLGELRFYYQVEPHELREQIDPLVRAAEERSRSACAVCGAIAEMQNVGGWIRPLCDRHLG